MTAPDSQAAVEAALVVLKSMGLSVDDLTAAPRDRAAVPTFAEYVPVVSAAVTVGTRKAYGTYWNRVVEHWGDRHLDEPTPSEIRQLMTLVVKAGAVQRRNSRGGRSSQEHLVGALRCLYRHAEDDGLIDEKGNPARKVDKPRRLPSTRRAVPDTRLAEINQVAATTGDDPELDTLILRLHTETARRRGGALALRPADLDREQSLVLLREKGETVRWQPVSPTLMAGLVRHAEERHAPPDGRLLRYRDGRQVTHPPYDGLWARIGRHLPWARTQQVSTHWIRHITLTWVERNFGIAVAHAYAYAYAYAGHTDGAGDTGNATSTYVRATLAEVATALAALVAAGTAQRRSQGVQREPQRARPPAQRRN
jgi:integrase/recombinase XerC